MAEQHLYINYSVEDIEKYLQGRMNAKDMHELERAALQDPFLADAIEGYRQADFSQTYQHLDDIALAITGAKLPAKIVAIPQKANYWWRVAVVIGLVVIAGGTVWYSSQQGGQAENKALATVQPAKPNEKVTSSIPPAAADSAAGLAKTDTTGQLVTNNTNNSKENEVQLVITEAPATIPGRAKAASPEVVAKVEAPVKSTQGYIAEDKNYTTPVQVLNAPALGIKITAAKPLAAADTALLANNNVLIANAPPAAGYNANYSIANNSALPLSKQTGPSANQSYTFDLKKQALFNVLPAAKIEGYIRDDKQQPLPNAMVYAGNRLTAITDARGYFRLNTADSQLTVQVSSAGYETKTALLKGRDSNAITINQLYLPGQGIEVTSFKSKARAKKVLVDSLAPEGGWQSFREYVYKKLHREKDMDTTGAVLTFMPGSVEIEFVVDENGTAKEFRVTKSLNKQSDAKALDVVRQWPRWITARRNAKGKVVIEF